MIQIILTIAIMLYISGLLIAIGFIGLWNQIEDDKIKLNKVWLSWYTVFNLVKLSNK